MRLATWNLENLYRPGGEYGPRTQAAYEAKLAALADVVRAVAPDVLAVQEVGDPAALGDLADLLGGGWASALSEHADERGIRVGFLARGPLERVVDARAFPAPLAPVQVDDDGTTAAAMGRGALVVRAAGVELVTCHLKSKLLRFGTDRFAPRDEGERARAAAYGLFRRAAEAVTVRGAADALLRGRGRERAVAVLGDLNDEPHAATTQILHGPPGSELGGAGFERPDRGDGDRLWNVAAAIPAEQRFTRVHRGRRELIDHVLVSHALVTALAGAGTIPPPPSIGDDPRERRDAPVSDHALLWAEFSAPAAA